MPLDRRGSRSRTRSTPLPHLSARWFDIDFTQVVGDASSNGTPQSNRHSIADHSTNWCELDRLARCYEFIVTGKALKNGCLSQRYRPILLRMTEPTIAIPVTLSRHRRGRFVPLHAAIDTRIGTTGVLLMAVGHESGRPISPRAARPGGANSRHILGRQGWGHV